MRKNTPIFKILRTNCTVIEAGADIQTIRFIFDHFPNQFLPVVRGLRFVGVILRSEFFKNFTTTTDQPYTAADLVSKEIVKLSPSNTLAEAKEVFDTKVFDMIPVADEDGDLVGIVLREDVENNLRSGSILPNSISSLQRIFA